MDVSGLKQAFPFRPDSTLGKGAAQEAVRKIRDANISILAGTDAPNPGTAHGATVHEELVRIVEAGLSPLEALTAATSVPAVAFGLADRGRVAPGPRADLVLVSGEPDADITATRDIVAVWVGGEKIDRESYRAMLDAQRAEAERLARVPCPPGSESGFVTEADWKEFTFPLSQFGGMDGHDLTGVLLTGCPAPGAFSLKIDEIRIE